jgi:hypothetical protein
MEKVLDSVKRGCSIQINDSGLFDLTITENGHPVETARNLSLKSAARIAVDKLGAEDNA